VPLGERSYAIQIAPGLLSRLGGECAALKLGSRCAIISDANVAKRYARAAEKSLRSAGFDPIVIKVPAGERGKSLRVVNACYDQLSTHRLERKSFIVALGGGVVGDLAGFAAASYLRGVAFIQVPTTLLAQIDASVGGKVAVNLPAGKNLVGAFYQPRLVLIDIDTLQTLPRRELTAGWCEAVKQGAVGDRKLFDRTVHFLGTHAAGVLHARGMRTQLSAIIAAHCRFKSAIVAGDERESIARDDARSRKILNFGHTTAHALEAVTAYRRFRHGEAVGYGMLVAGEISKNLGMLRPDALESLRQAVRACGPLPLANDIEINRLMTAMKSDKKSIAGSVKWVLLKGIGKGHIVDGREVRTSVLRKALSDGLRPLR
jgi:3-dehydroquinate synthase